MRPQVPLLTTEEILDWVVEIALIVLGYFS